MYQLVKVIARRMETESRWEEVDLSTTPINQIYRLYSRCWLVLSNPFITNQVALDFQLVRKDIGTSNATIPEWLVSNGSNALPTTDRIPELKVRYALWNDGFRGGFKIQPVSPNASPDAELPIGSKSWLYLSKPKIDWTLFNKCCMVTVNGFFHRLVGNASGAWVAGGMHTQIKSGQNQLGLLSFRELGRLQYIPITESMLYKQDPNQLMRDQVNINVGVDLENYTVLLVLGGYLHLLDDRAFKQHGMQTLMVNTRGLPLIERFHESRYYFDFDDFPWHKTDRNPSQIALDDFYSDAFLTRYFTMDQSFIVLLDNRDIFLERKPLHLTPGPGLMVSYEKPNHLLVNGVGKSSEYWATLEDGQYSVTVQNNFYHLRQYHTTDANSLLTVGEERPPYDPVIHGNAHFLKIGTDI